MDKVVGEGAEGSIDAPSFIVAAGDNIYPADGDNPTRAEFDELLQLFKKPHLAELPVYHVRGNHDTYFDWKDELELSMRQSQWKLPSFYYTKMVPAGPNGELMGILFIDTVLMLCASNFEK